jgi:VanZ family protein
MSSQDAVSVSESKNADVFAHKLAHIVEYAVLYITFIIAFSRKFNSPTKTALYGLAFITIYGITDEFHQSLNPTRQPKLSDVFVDFTGGICGYLVIKLYKKARN